ncbi:unnamed protein product [Caenorhabditis auriculariae]|uniref:Uncharacterized protein n=1 Tax=Caenorhabditis auriculariae TaxID=2777116 RepID=A0A8S1HJ83_9PELO|nr:unnamed protein product [Caenorhabditis auriculariae]
MMIKPDFLLSVASCEQNDVVSKPEMCERRPVNGDSMFTPVESSKDMLMRSVEKVERNSVALPRTPQ